MVKMRGARRKNRGQDGLTSSTLGQDLHALLKRLGGSRERSRLAEFRKRWRELIGPVLGPELAALSKPIGSRGSKEKKLLLLGAPDAMLLQELSTLAPEILEVANAFIGSEYYSGLRTSLAPEELFWNGAQDLIDGQAEDDPLASVRADMNQSEAKIKAPTLSGQGLGMMNPDSPVARAYARFLAARKG